MPSISVVVRDDLSLGGIDNGGHPGTATYGGRTPAGRGRHQTRHETEETYQGHWRMIIYYSSIENRDD